MRFFLMYYDRFTTATSSKALYDIAQNHTVLCHANKEKFKNIYGDIIQTNESKGIQNNFNFILDSIEYGDWAICMSDDYKHSKRLMNGEFVLCGLDFVIRELISVIHKAEKAGINLIGLNATGNSFYAKSKYGKYGLVDGRLFAIRKTSFRFHPQISTIPDYYATAYHLKKYGGNLILNYCYAEFDRYKAGGLGTLSQRLDEKRKDVALMKNIFPKQVVIKDKLNQPKGSHIILKR